MQAMAILPPFIGGITAGSCIRMADGSLKKIENIMPGDEVRSTDGDAKVLKLIDLTSQGKQNVYQMSNVERFGFTATQLFVAAGKKHGQHCAKYLCAEPQQVENFALRKVGLDALKGGIVATKAGRNFLPTMVENLSYAKGNNYIYQLLLDDQDWFIAGNETQQFPVLSFAPLLREYPSTISSEVKSLLVGHEKSVLKSLESISWSNWVDLSKKINFNDDLVVLRSLEKTSLNHQEVLPDGLAKPSSATRTLHYLLMSRHARQVESLINLGWRIFTPDQDDTQNMVIAISLLDIEWSPSLVSQQDPTAANAPVGQFFKDGAIERLESVPGEIKENSYPQIPGQVFNFSLRLASDLDDLQNYRAQIPSSEDPSFINPLDGCVYFSTEKKMDSTKVSSWKLDMTLPKDQLEFKGSYSFNDNLDVPYRKDSMLLKDKSGAWVMLTFDIRLITKNTQAKEGRVKDGFDQDQKQKFKDGFLRTWVDGVFKEVRKYLPVKC